MTVVFPMRYKDNNDVVLATPFLMVRPCSYVDKPVPSDSIPNIASAVTSLTTQERL